MVSPDQPRMSPRPRSDPSPTLAVTITTPPSIERTAAHAQRIVGHDDERSHQCTCGDDVITIAHALLGARRVGTPSTHGATDARRHHHLLVVAVTHAHRVRPSTHSPCLVATTVDSPLALAPREGSSRVVRVSDIGKPVNVARGESEQLPPAEKILMTAVISLISL